MNNNQGLGSIRTTDALSGITQHSGLSRKSSPGREMFHISASVIAQSQGDPMTGRSFTGLILHLCKVQGVTHHPADPISQ